MLIFVLEIELMLHVTNLKDNGAIFKRQREITIVYDQFSTQYVQILYLYINKYIFIHQVQLQLKCFFEAPITITVKCTIFFNTKIISMSHTLAS